MEGYRNKYARLKFFVKSTCHNFLERGVLFNNEDKLGGTQNVLHNKIDYNKPFESKCVQIRPTP